MKFFHLSDLHLGMRLKNFSLLEDQKHILDEILSLAESERPDAVVIAGDVYDRAVPSAEAVELFDDFLSALSEKGFPTLIIFGNHDSPERVAFGSRLMKTSGIYLSPVYEGHAESVSFSDGFGTVRFHLLPFLKPSGVRRFYPDEEINSYTDAIRCAVSHMDIDAAERNVIVTHQFVTGASQSGSEEINVGGTDNVDASVFDAFDYVALGHIHGAQSVGRETIRYCGTPLKYSFSEKDQEKSVTVVEMREKGNIAISVLPLHPLHDMREIRGTYNDLVLYKNYAGTDTADYIRAILTDEDEVPNAMARLREVYPNIMNLDYDNTRTRTSTVVQADERRLKMTDMELLAEFYKDRTGCELSEEQTRYAKELFEKLREELK